MVKKHIYIYIRIQQNVRVKLSTVVTQKETFHPFLMSFSFSRLLETIQAYLDAYLEQNPSDYLLKVKFPYNFTTLQHGSSTGGPWAISGPQIASYGHKHAQSIELMPLMRLKHEVYFCTQLYSFLLLQFRGILLCRRIE